MMGLYNRTESRQKLRENLLPLEDLQNLLVCDRYPVIPDENTM